MADKEISQNTIAHLGMIQGVINRMASNSLSLKSLAVAIAAAVIALAGTQQYSTPILAIAGLLPVIVFWIMDAQYLRLERLYRKLYDHIRNGKDFEPFGMNASSFSKDVVPLWRIMISWSVCWFYFATAAVLVVISIIS